MLTCATRKSPNRTQIAGSYGLGPCTIWQIGHEKGKVSTAKNGQDFLAVIGWLEYTNTFFLAPWKLVWEFLEKPLRNSLLEKPFEPLQKPLHCHSKTWDVGVSPRLAHATWSRRCCTCRFVTNNCLSSRLSRCFNFKGPTALGGVSAWRAVGFSKQQTSTLIKLKQLNKLSAGCEYNRPVKTIIKRCRDTYFVNKS